jgi:hypothetical protein
MSNHELYDFTEWSDWRLNEALTDLLETRMIPHGDERRQAISRRLAHIVFELNQRGGDE